MAATTIITTAIRAQGLRIRIHNLYRPICLYIKTKHDEEHKDGNIVLLQHTSHVTLKSIKITFS
jgi:hypothetical protein